MPALIRTPGATITGVPTPPPATVLPPTGTPGVVLLFEPGHPDSDFTGIATSPASITDIADAWSQITIGSPKKLTVTNSVSAASTTAFVERTGVGGLHAASAHSGQTANEIVSVSMGAVRQSYVAARAAAGDAFYVSVWMRETRPSADSYTAGVPLAGIRKGSALGDFYAVAGSLKGTPWAFPNSGTRLLGQHLETAGGVTFAAVAAHTPVTAPFAAADNVTVLGAFMASLRNAAPSEIIYRVYVENLTATGRSFATVSAADRQEFGDLAVAPAGRYAADTWTIPTSVLA